MFVGTDSRVAEAASRDDRFRLPMVSPSLNVAVHNVPRLYTCRKSRRHEGDTTGYWYVGGHGLYSTPQDYIRFERALLLRGELDAVRTLAPETADAAFCNQIGEIDFPADTPTVDPATTNTMYAGPGNKWGYGLMLNTDDVPGGPRGNRSMGRLVRYTLLHRPHHWNLCIHLPNSLPFIARDDAWKMYGDFEKALYAAL